MPQRVILVDDIGGSYAHQNATVIAATATAATITTSLTNYFHRGAYWVLNIGSDATAPSVTFRVHGIAADGNFFSIMSSAAQTATNTAVLFSLYPGQAETANQHVDGILPRDYRIMIDSGNDANPTYSVTEVRLI